ncbi:hypothetical protein HPB51_018604 [Rhipicephalus microplus]|uniref:GTPase Era, mitochondrial n=1 Tax=Rhipicephalus microplus TaxID=6941 RepID=A0A9J6DAN2_RHIMP|nr:hypothetical protein HPB51_018604 [Rhipicephalus microplus]
MFSRRQVVTLTAVTRSILQSSRSRQSTCASDFPRPTHRSVPRTLLEYSRLQSAVPAQPSNPKLLRVAIIGQPNVGKSTLVNQLMRWKVCAVSSKVHTTRHNAKAIFVNGETQIVILDTPGIVDLDHGRKHHLEATMIVDPEHALLNADLVAVMVDASDHWRRHTLDEETLRLLEYNAQLTSVLIVNKVDLLRSKRQILEFTHSLTGGVVGGVTAYREKIVKKRLSPEELFARAGETSKTETANLQAEALDRMGVQNQLGQSKHKNCWRNFSRVFMISALNDDGFGKIGRKKNQCPQIYVSNFNVNSSFYIPTRNLDNTLNNFFLSLKCVGKPRYEVTNQRAREFDQVVGLTLDPEDLSEPLTSCHKTAQHCRFMGQRKPLLYPKLAQPQEIRWHQLQMHYCYVYSAHRYT